MCTAGPIRLTSVLRVDTCRLPKPSISGASSTCDYLQWNSRQALHRRRRSRRAVCRLPILCTAALLERLVARPQLPGQRRRVRGLISACPMLKSATEGQYTFIDALVHSDPAIIRAAWPGYTPDHPTRSRNASPQNHLRHAMATGQSARAMDQRRLPLLLPSTSSTKGTGYTMI